MLIAGYQIYRRKLGTLTEIAFLLGAICFSSYAFSDWLLFNSATKGTALVLARASIVSVTLAAFFFFMFTKLFLTKPHRMDVPSVLPLVAALIFVLDGLLLDLNGGVPWGWSPVYDPLVFNVWLAIIVVYVALGAAYVYRTFKVVRESSKFLGRRMMGILISFLAALGLGLATNGYFQIAGIPMMPLFSTFLIVPGVMTLYVLVPLAKNRISGVIHKWKSQRYNVLGAYIIYVNGTLMASKTSYEDKSVDEDIFSATLDAIQTFMSRSFPYLFGKSLRRIEHGEVKILIERGRYSYLALVIEGEDTDTLWVRMRELVEEFELTNMAELVDWSGITDRLKVDRTLEACFSTEAFFA